MYTSHIKRIIDFTIAFISLLILSPIFFLIMVFLFLSNNGKPFFFQKRPGKDEKIFCIIKFRTMNDRKDKNGNLLPDGERVTKIGNFIRKFSLDEIPQLINVLKGDMSLVGPRPLLISYLVHYSDEQKQRHAVKPGITGWAQVNGRNTISWQQKFAYDVWYVQHVSFMLDCKILGLTFLKVIKSDGVLSPAHANMGKFTGND